MEAWVSALRVALPVAGAAAAFVNAFEAGASAEGTKKVKKDKKVKRGPKGKGKDKATKVTAGDVAMQDVD